MPIAPVSATPKGRALPDPPAFKRLVDSATFSVMLFGVIVSLIVYGAFVGAQSMGYNWQWYRIPAYFYRGTEDGFQWGEICTGLVRTLMLSGTSFALAVVLGLIVALLRLSGLVVGTGLAIAFLEAIRNIPLLVLLYLFYYVLGPIFGFDRYWASILCLAVFHAALISEIFRAGINAVPMGQWEAATSIR